MGDEDVASQLTPKRTYMDVSSMLKHQKVSIARTLDEMHGHATTHYNSLMEKQHKVEGPYLETIMYCICCVNATTQKRHPALT